MVRLSQSLLAICLLLAVVPAVSPTADAQPVEETYAVGVSVDDAQVDLPLNGKAEVRVEIQDRSLTGIEGVPSIGSTVLRQFRIQPRIVVPGGGPQRGWAASAAPSIINAPPGATVNTTLEVFNSGAVQPNEVEVVMNVTMEVRGTVVTNEATVVARLEQYRRADIQFRDAPPSVGPNGITFYTIFVSNLGNYPDTFTVEVIDSGSLDVGFTESFGLQPQEERPVQLSIVGPREVFVYGSTELVTVRAMPQGNPDGGFTTSIPVRVSGWWWPPWTYPLWIVLIAVAAYGGHQTYQKVKDDRERYDHPGPKPPIAEQKEKLAAIEERDPDKYEALKAALIADWKAEKEAYKERKKRGKTRHPRKVEKALRRQERKRERIRRKGVKRVKKGKKKGKEPREILQDLDEDERDELKADLPAMLAAPTAAGAALAAKPEEERTALTDLREDLVADRHRRLRAEALALIRLRRQEGHDAEEIREEMDVAHRQALGPDLDEALAGRVDESPEAILAGLNPLDRRKGEKYVDKLRKEKEKLRAKALKIIQKGKRKDWSREEIRSRLTDEQVHLVGGLLPMMLDAHFPEEAELLLLDPSKELTKKEEKRRETLQTKLHKRRLKEMESAAKKIEKYEEKGYDRDAILGELTRSERWAVQDFLDILLKPLPEAMAGLEAYLDRHDLPEAKREVMEKHLDLLRKKEQKFAKKGLKRVEKLKKKGESGVDIAQEIPQIEREALHGALPYLLRPSLREEIAGLEEFVETQDLADEELEIWEDYLETLRDERQKRAEKGVKRLKKHKKKDREPDEIHEAMDPKRADALGRTFEPMVEAALPEDVEVLWQLSRPKRRERKLRKAREKANKAREKARKKALKKVKKAQKKGVAAEDAVAGLPYSYRRVLRSEPAAVEDPEGEAEADQAEPEEDAGGRLGGLLPFGKAREEPAADEERKARAKELLAQGKSPSEVARILKEEREAAPAEGPVDEGREAADAEPGEETSGGGLRGLLPFGKGRAAAEEPADAEEAGEAAEGSEPAWKTDLAKDLLAAGIPPGRVTELVREAEEEMADMGTLKRKLALKKFVRDARKGAGREE